MNARRRCCLVALLALALAPAAATAAPVLQSLRYTTDIAVELGSTLVTPQTVAQETAGGSVSLVAAGSYPTGTGIVAYDRAANGDQFLVFDVDLELPGGLVVRPGDVVRFDGAAYTLAFDAAARGVPPGVQVDALRVLGAGTFLLSFDTSVDFGSFVADDEDIVQFAGAVATLFFDGSQHGVPDGVDLDAFDRLATGDLLLSFDTSGVIAGISFNDEDVLAFSPATNSWSVVYAGAVQHTRWAAADLSALSATLGGVAPPPPSIQGSMPGPGGMGGSGGIAAGATRLFGVGAPHAQTDDACLAIFAAGANGVPDQPPGSVDDELLGTGSTDANGNFVDGGGLPGIPLNRPVRPNDLLFAADLCSGRVGGTASIRVPAPALEPRALALAIALLLVVAWRRRVQRGA